MSRRTTGIRVCLPYVILMVIFLINGYSYSYDTLSGNLPKVLKNKGVPYMVVSDIFVPLAKKVTIEPGTILLFKNFTGLHVEGQLIAEGLMNKPIIFTSEFDRKHNAQSELYPNPYDWNGIYIHENGLGSSLAYTKVLYSVYGIYSETKFIRVSPGLFKNNGKTDLVIEGQEHITSEENYTYALSIKDARVDGVPVRILMRFTT